MTAGVPEISLEVPWCQSQWGEQGRTITIKDEAKLSVLMIAESPELREGLRQLLTQEVGFELAAETSSGTHGIHLFSQHRPDVVVVSVNLSDGSGFEVVRFIRQVDSHCSIMLLATSPDPFVAQVGRLLGANAVCDVGPGLVPIREHFIRLGAC